jgi:hypothetical protein
VWAKELGISTGRQQELRQIVKLFGAEAATFSVAVGSTYQPKNSPHLHM